MVHKSNFVSLSCLTNKYSGNPIYVRSKIMKMLVTRNRSSNDNKNQLTNKESYSVLYCRQKMFGESLDSCYTLQRRQYFAGKAGSSEILCSKSKLYLTATAGRAGCKQKRKRRHRCSSLCGTTASKHTETYSKICSWLHTYRLSSIHMDFLLLFCIF